jgi:16S rRNA (guanine527-N7)-methyltransferase
VHAATAMPEGFAPSLDGLARRFALDAEQTKQLRTFASMIVHDELAPTTVRDPGRVRDDHLADALVALELPELRAAELIADIGAGAGVPGLPLAVALPGARVALVEANARKCEFMRSAIEAIGLRNAEVVHGRAETWADGLGRCDLVTARALAPLDVVAEYAAPLLKIGGALVAWRGKPEPEVEADASRAAQILGLSVQEPVRVHPFEGAEHRYLHLMVKLSPAPDRFPRRDGVARKRPLGRA